MAITVDDKIKDIMACPEAIEVLDEFAPGFTTNKQLKMAYGMTLREVHVFPQAKINDECLEKIAEGFAEIE